MRVSTPDSADRVSVSSWAQANAAPISEAIRQASETVRVRISAPPLQPAFPRDDIDDSRRRACHESHARAAGRLSLLAPNQCALGVWVNLDLCPKFSPSSLARTAAY